MYILNYLCRTLGSQHCTLHTVFKGAGGGGPRPKIIFNVIFVEGRQSYQMLFTGSKNIDPSRIYRIFKIAKYILAIISKFLILTLKTYLLLQFLRLETWQLSCSTHS